MTDIASKLKNAYQKATKAGLPAKDFKGIDKFINESQQLEKELAAFRKKADELIKLRDKLAKQIGDLEKQTKYWDKAINDATKTYAKNKKMMDLIKPIIQLLNQLEAIIQKAMRQQLKLD